MFTPEERERVRARVLELARVDDRIAGAAITGSAAAGIADRWSDIDLFFGVADDHAVSAVLADLSELIYRDLDAIHHFDLSTPTAVYRAFLLPNWLELDVGLTNASTFGAGGPRFRLVFGETVEREYAQPPSVDHLIGLGWHHVYHGRVCIGRGETWRAEYWISALRDNALTLACLRLGLPATYARGFDELPSEVTGPLEWALVRSLAPGDLRGALAAAAEGLLREVREVRPELAARLEAPFLELIGD